MKILFLTQRVDLDDDLLGFVHGWLKKLAPKFSKINVIALGTGNWNLPENVRVFSLGKQKNHKKFRKIIYLLNFYGYIWGLRKDYDLVFVHMNKEYVVLGGLFWRLMSKKVVLWYNHRQGNFWAKLAFIFSHKIFYTSPFSFAAKFRKAVMMPAGIETEIFKKDKSIQKIPNSILYLGRISPIKNLETLMGATKILEKQGVGFLLDIVGDAPERDQEYMDKLKDSAGGSKIVNFSANIPNWQTPEIYNRHEISVNLTNFGSFDKSVLESMACENIVILSNLSFQSLLPGRFIFQEKNQDELAQKIQAALKLTESEKEEVGKNLRNFVLKNHSLDLLVEKLMQIFNGLYDK